MSLNDINSLSHTKWNCKYHIVFARNTEERYSTKKNGQQVTIPAQLADRIHVYVLRGEQRALPEPHQIMRTAQKAPM